METIHTKDCQANTWKKLPVQSLDYTEGLSKDVMGEIP